MLREVKMLSIRTSEQITAEINVKFGFIPPFFSPAIENPQVLENLWHQTLSAYINNPLSAQFKEKLSAYLSRFCAVPYCLICHSCSMRSLGIKAQDILELLESPPPTETEIEHHLFVLATSGELTLVGATSAVEDSLLPCAIFVALEQEPADYCRSELRRILGVNYQYLITFIAYMKMCHEWMVAHPEVAYEEDQRVQDNFNDLLADEPGLTDFFDTYWQKVSRERQSRAEYLAQVTERQRNEAALRKAAAQNLCLARAVTSASDGILITDPNQPDNPIIYTNPAFSRITGYQPEEIIGQNWRFLQVGTDEQAIAQINNAIAQRREVKLTMLNYRSNNQRFWSELKISPVFSEAGELLNFIGIQTDITERQQAEAALKKSEARYRSVVTAMQEGIVIQDADGRISACNASAERILGRTSDQIIARTSLDPCWQTIHEDGSCFPGETHPAMVTLRTGKPCSNVTMGICQPDGGITWILINSQPLFTRGQTSPYAVVTSFSDITERKQTEEKLIRSSKAIESTSDAISMADMSGKPIYHNQAFIKLYGYNIDELNAVGGLPAMYTQLEIAEQVLTAIQNGRSWSGEVELKTKSGKFISTLLRADCIVDDAGNHIGLISVCTDITKRKQAEIALRQQIERERLVLEIAQRIRQSLNLEEILSTTVAEVQQFLQVERVFIYRFQPDWSGDVIVESVNPGWLPLLAMHIKDSFFGKADGRELYRQGRIQATDDIYTASLAKCHVDLLVELQIRANLVVPILQGQHLWGLLVANHCSAARQWQQLEIDLLKQLATQVAIAIQQSTLFQQAQTQLIERQRAEQKIREQAALLNIATDAIRVQDLETQILFWNKGAERLYGWKAAEALGKNAKELLYKGYPLEIAAAQKIVLDKGEWYGELHQVTKFGKEIIVESRWTLVRDQQGKPKSVLVVNTDITQKKQLEAQFLRAQRMESIGTLAGGIAHDLNNVLAPILMSAQLLQLKTTDDRTQQLLQTIEANAKRGGNLVKQVLSFARGVEGKHTILQVRHLISEIKHIAMQTFPKSIQFYTDIAPELWSVSGDATQLHQVLMNLSVNARDAMPDGGILRISASNLLIDQNYAQMNLEATVGAYILITVSDTGTGIPPEIVDRIFEPFFTTKEQGKGTGLGLATVIGIIKSHGGFVDVYSEVGQGTQFKVYLPAVEGTTTQPEKDMELPTGNGELILVVDDESAICEVTKTSLLTYNYEVLTASDGIEAIALYAQHKHEISLVLMDMMMPSMDGPTTIRTLQKLNPQVKIIAVSGLDSSDKVNAAISAGAKAFLSKPYTAQELLKIINSVLNAKVSAG